MALPAHLNTREHKKFSEVGSLVAVNVLPLDGLSIPLHDAGVKTSPSSTQEVYTFKTGGVSGTTVGVLTINYVDSTKEEILNWEIV